MAAATAITRTLRGAGTDWHALADAITTAPAPHPPKRPKHPPPPRSPRWENGPSWTSVTDRKGFLTRIKDEPWLTDWDREFVLSIRADIMSWMPRDISPKQRAQLDRLVRRAVEYGVAIWA